jgi:peptidyl-prolyl cis-trans isomerase C
LHLALCVVRRPRDGAGREYDFLTCEGILRNLPTNLLSLLVFQIALCGWPQSARSAPQAASSTKTESLPGERVVLSVGDDKMSAADVEKFVQSLSPQLRAYYAGPGKNDLPEHLVRMKVLLAEAIKHKLAEQPDVAYALELDRESILADAALVRLEQSVPLNDQELQELYRKEKTQFEEVRIRRLLIRTENAGLKSGSPDRPPLPESEARKKLEDIRSQILAGADFARMAKQYSEDAATAVSGGDMGYAMRDQIMPPFSDAATALRPGQVSNILATPFGLEIIKVEDKRIKPFEGVKPRLESDLRQSKARDLVQHLADQYKVVIDKEFFSSRQSPRSGTPVSSPSH